eukprot:m.71888 g.71888  ORF g.71888 m.71888 type:complete len:515 (-) comp50208_c0_seq8:901-2445(-)
MQDRWRPSVRPCMSSTRNSRLICVFCAKFVFHIANSRHLFCLNCCLCGHVFCVSQPQLCLSSSPFYLLIILTVQPIYDQYWIKFQHSFFATHRLVLDWSLVDALQRSYESIYTTQCELDERLWLAAQPHHTHTTAHSTSHSSTHTTAHSRQDPKQSIHSLALSQDSDLTEQNAQHLGRSDSEDNTESQSFDPADALPRSVVPVEATPVSQALQGVQKLLQVIAQSSEEASATLRATLARCNPDPFPALAALALRFEEQFVSGQTVLLGESARALAIQRFAMVKRLFYRLLLEILLSEETKPKFQGFDLLINNTTFVHSLWAVAAQIILFLYQPQSAKDQSPAATQFPWILSVMNIFAYDFYKVIEVIIRSEHQMPADLMKHLADIEQQIVLHLAWKDDSPLLDAVERAATIPTSHQSQYRDTPDPQTQQRLLRDAIDSLPHPAHGIFQSPRPLHHSKLDALLSATQIPEPAPVTRSPSLDLFFRKLYRIAFVRLKRICDSLQLNSQTVNYPLTT